MTKFSYSITFLIILRYELKQIVVNQFYRESFAIRAKYKKEVKNFLAVIFDLYKNKIKSYGKLHKYCIKSHIIN